MDPRDFAKLAGISSSPKANVETMPDMARQIAMLAGVVPARGHSALASDTLVADAGVDPSLLGPVAQPDESFFTTMTRAAGMNGAALEEGVSLPLDAIPPPVFAPPPGIPVFEAEPAAASPTPYQPENIATMVVRTDVPAWAWQLRDAVESLLEKTIEPKDALKAMKAALEASKATPRIAPEPVAETVLETEEERQWKSYYNRMLED